MLWNLVDLQYTNLTFSQVSAVDGWIPARPANHKYICFVTRLKNAWLVLTGKADAVKWPGGQ